MIFYLCLVCKMLQAATCSVHEKRCSVGILFQMAPEINAMSVGVAGGSPDSRHLMIFDPTLSAALNRSIVLIFG